MGVNDPCSRRRPRHSLERCAGELERDPYAADVREDEHQDEQPECCHACRSADCHEQGREGCMQCLDEACGAPAYVVNDDSRGDRVHPAPRLSSCWLRVDSHQERLLAVLDLQKDCLLAVSYTHL